MTKFELVQNDTKPQIDLSLTDEITGTPIDLSAPATVVRMFLKQRGADVIKDTLLLAKLPGRVTRINEETERQTITVAPPYDVDGSGGRCAVQWNPTSLDTPGRFFGEVKVYFAGGGVMTWVDFLEFEIRATVGPVL